MQKGRSRERRQNPRAQYEKEDGLNRSRGCDGSEGGAENGGKPKGQEDRTRVGGGIIPLNKG
ncbi:hypothetical protein C922_05617 [Plasmodium inui San Antonio 1]|uniref:Uncharacterized protein n=1 Tax=Plasmodium inui San Antonio 1 TaxID=1237626 RepID=W6ZXN5_9APIC|nr:hypothetical protein C922_05617 [Plasmodium inui San Antonio 1]EUD64005.1 hypothetical protein C922_05617 [Plasmodium inui San Antonio 1]